MRRRWWQVASMLPLALVLSGCFGTGGSDESGGSTDANKARGSVKAVDGITGYAQQLAQAGRVRIGVKFDAPGLSQAVAGTSTPAGFEVEVGKILAGGLGISPENIQWVQVLGNGREQALASNAVDFVVASYGMSAESESKVGLAGPYYITGAQFLVRAADKAIVDAMKPGPTDTPRLRKINFGSGQQVCSIAGSPISAMLKSEFKLKPIERATYADCVNLVQSGGAMAMVADGAVAAGFAHASGGSLAVAGDPFSEEKYGVGYPKGMAGMCEFVQSTLHRSYTDGSWMEAWSETLANSGVETPPEPPSSEPC